MNLSDRAYINKISMILHTVIVSVLSVAYVFEIFKGSRTVPYVLIMVVVGLIPVIVDLILYAKNKECVYIHHVMCIGYSLWYIMLVFTGVSSHTYVYAIPMYIVVTLFSDLAVSAMVCVGGLLVSLAHIVYIGFTVGYTSADVKDIEIEVACMLLVGLFMVIVAIANKKMSDRNSRRIKEQQDELQQVLDSIVAETDTMTDDIAVVSANMDSLGESVEHIKLAMNEIASGTNETASSIQDQLERTNEIQQDIIKVKDTAEFIEKNMTHTDELIIEGRQHMEDLTAQVAKSMEANDKVTSKMNELSEYTAQMNTIIETITSIANSTGMLALNASIEAARAGEAGRGFAVVASQISELANQTKNATVNITNIIGNINNELGEVTSAVDEVTEGNKANVESTKVVVNNFASISEGSKMVVEQTKELTETVDALESANSDIVEKIQTISAITEEVSAHTSETADDCEANSTLVNDIADTFSKLNESAVRLKNIK